MNNTTVKNNAFFRQLLFLGALICVGLLIIKQLNFFVGSFLGAFTIYVVLRDLQFKLVEKKNWRPWLASLLLVLATTILLLGLGVLLIEMVVAEVSNVDASHIVINFNHFLKDIGAKLGINSLPDGVISSSQSLLANLASSLANTTYSFIANILMMIVVLYFMLSNGRAMEKKLTDYAPFKGENLAIIKLEVKNMIYSNAIGMPIILLVQGLAASLIYWLLNIHGPFFWGFLTAICGLLPVVGTMIVYVPVAIYLFLIGDIWQGIALLAYGIVVISNVDNLCRIVLMKKMTDTHPLITIFGVVLGIPIFGFWGIIFGPLLLAGFFLLIKMYYLEYQLLPPEKVAPEDVKELEKR